MIRISRVHMHACILVAPFLGTVVMKLHLQSSNEISSPQCNHASWLWMRAANNTLHDQLFAISMTPSFMVTRYGQPELLSTTVNISILLHVMADSFKKMHLCTFLDLIMSFSQRRVGSALKYKQVISFEEDYSFCFWLHHWTGYFIAQVDDIQAERFATLINRKLRLCYEVVAGFKCDVINSLFHGFLWTRTAGVTEKVCTIFNPIFTGLACYHALGHRAYHLFAASTLPHSSQSVIRPKSFEMDHHSLTSALALCTFGARRQQSCLFGVFHSFWMYFPRASTHVETMKQCAAYACDVARMCIAVAVRVLSFPDLHSIMTDIIAFQKIWTTHFGGPQPTLPYPYDEGVTNMSDHVLQQVCRSPRHAHKYRQTSETLPFSMQILI